MECQEMSEGEHSGPKGPKGPKPPKKEKPAELAQEGDHPHPDFSGCESDDHECHHDVMEAFCAEHSCPEMSEGDHPHGPKPKKGKKPAELAQGAPAKGPHAGDMKPAKGWLLAQDDGKKAKAAKAKAAKAAKLAQDDGKKAKAAKAKAAKA